MADTTEQDRKAGEEQKRKIQEESDQFERLVKAFYLKQQMKPISWDKKRDKEGKTCTANHLIWGTPEQEKVDFLKNRDTCRGNNRVWGVPEKGEKSADFVFQSGPHTLVLVEAKGVDIDSAIEQLKNLGDYVRKKAPHMSLEFHIVLRKGTDPENLTKIDDETRRYRAKKSFGRLLLYKDKYVLTNAKGEEVKILSSERDAGTKVFVIIDPKSER